MIRSLKGRIHFTHIRNLKFHSQQDFRMNDFAFAPMLASMAGNWVENGEYPANLEFLKEMVENISYNNAVSYFL